MLMKLTPAWKYEFTIEKAANKYFWNQFYYLIFQNLACHLALCFLMFLFKSSIVQH